MSERQVRFQRTIGGSAAGVLTNLFPSQPQHTIDNMVLTRFLVAFLLVLPSRGQVRRRDVAAPEGADAVLNEVRFVARICAVQR